MYRLDRMPLSLTTAPGRALIASFIVAASLSMLAGCGGGGGDEGALLAEVGEVQIRVADYERQLALLENTELPRDAAGRFLDMGTTEGRNEFLTTIINKELLVAKATELGYMDDAQIISARKSLEAYEANVVMATEYMEANLQKTTDADFDRYYAKLGERRVCSYLVTNFEKDAAEARKDALSGTDWLDVVDRYHAGTLPNSGMLNITVPYGRYDEVFEKAIFDTEIGDYSAPIETAYGWWLVRVESVENVELPPLEDMKGRIDNVNFNRQKAKAQLAFRDATRRKHNAYINEEALWKVFQGLPESEILIDPVTNEPVPTTDLKNLDVLAADLDMVLFSYDLGGENHAYTVGDYKLGFDKMSTFQRPKKDQLVPGLRHKIRAEFERALLTDEAKTQGFHDHPTVQAKVNKKVEELMVTNLYNDLVVFEERITGDDLSEYWAGHADDFTTPEMRDGHLAIVANKDAAVAAVAALEGGAKWKDVVAEYGTDEANRGQDGKITNLSAASSGPVRDLLFGLAEGQRAEPSELPDGRYALVACARIAPAVPSTIEESREMMGKAIRAERKEQSFQNLLAKWTEEIGVVRYEENLDQVQTWEELTSADDDE